MREIMEIILATIERERMLVSLPFGLAKLQALFLQFAPGPLETDAGPGDAVAHRDNVVSDAAKAAGLTLEGLGIVPDSLEAIAPQYLWRFRKTGQFAAARARDFITAVVPAFAGTTLEESSYRPIASAIRPSVPTMTRHHANSVKPWRVT